MPRPGLLATMRGAGGAVTVAYLSTSTVTTDGLTQTHSAVGIGAAEAGRVIIVAGYVRAGLNPTVTIGGVSATVVESDSSGHVAIVAWASVPTGTTADVALTSADTIFRSSLAIYRSTGSATLSGSATATGSGSAATVTVPSGGFAVAASGTNLAFSDASCTWANVTEDTETYFENFGQMSAAHSTTAGSTAATPTWSGGSPVVTAAVAFG